MKANSATLAAALLLGASAALGHGGHGGAHAIGAPREPQATSFGRPGDANRISRTVVVEMSDASCIAPAELRLKRGETVRFLVRNAGTQLHEWVLGTSHELTRHAEQGPKDPDLGHDEPYILHVEPGEIGTLVWHFTRVGLFGYGCLIHDARESGMHGRINVFP